MSATRDWLKGSLAARALLLGTLAKGITLTLGALARSPSATVETFDTVADACLVAAALVLIYRAWLTVRHRVLWRVRRKLTLSYVFIGFVPVFLVILFFLVSGLLLFFNVGSYLMRTRVQALVDQVHFLAETAALDVQRVRVEGARTDALARRQREAAARYPNLSYALVPIEHGCEGRALPRVEAAARTSAGPWAHLDAPMAAPAWVPCDGAAGLLAFTEGPEGQTRLAVRAIELPDGGAMGYALVVDLPLGDQLVRQLQDETGIGLGNMTAIEEGDAGAGETPAPGGPAPAPVVGRALDGWVGRESGANALVWVTLIDYVDWASGGTGALAVSFQMNPLVTYERISASSLARISNLDFGQLLLILLSVVGGMFLVIQIVAFGMGLALARSITGSVHELFVGTERVRQGDFTHKIAIHSNDQLGALASSFNSMTASMEDLLEQKAEKDRLEQELRIAREIQMSLLPPRGGVRMRGLVVDGYCRPAREVGGDYYDLFPLDEHRLGLLIADVAGKGTSAALYMAELKGVALSLSRRYRSPRELLIEANRTLAPHLDTRSFITITYALVDMQARTLTYARAGHCPLIYLPGPGTAGNRVQVLAPEGMVLGLKLDGGEMFTRLLEEATLPLAAGDLFVLFTDGLTDAMNHAGDCFGDERLSALVQCHGRLPVEELRDRILTSVEDFVGSADQHDDMTMLCVRVDDVDSPQTVVH